MLTLMLKDLRLLRPIILTAFGLAVLFCGVLPGIDYWQWQPSSNPINSPTSWDNTVQAVNRGVMFLWLAWPVLGAVVGSVAFAHERRERWADLVGVLPVPRWRLVLCKSAACVGVMAMLAVGIAVIFVAATAADVRHVSRWDDLTQSSFVSGFVAGLSLAILLFGTGWLGSSLLGSATIAVGVAIGAFGGAFAWAFITYIGSLPSESRDRVAFVLAGVAASVGAVAFGIGCGVQTLRRSP